MLNQDKDRAILFRNSNRKDFSIFAGKLNHHGRHSGIKTNLLAGAQGYYQAGAWLPKRASGRFTRLHGVFRRPLFPSHEKK